MKRLASICITVLAALALASPAAAQLVEGKDFARLKTVQPVETGKKIEVIEFFSYGCPHCADLEPYLDAWLAKLPADVQFRRIPVMFQPRWEPLAKIYYTLDALGVESKLSPEVFKAIHTNGIPMWEDKAFFDWAASKGLDRAKVADTYNSFGVNSKFRQARKLAQEVYDVQSVPTIVVDGKFATNSSRIQHSATPAAIDFLVAKARAERPKG
jgi:thiol:disulfide interchange protein DsbA